MIDPYEYHIADEMKRTRTPDKTMTAETDLLPLPSVLLNWPHPTNHAAIRDYARANLAEMQREVEGLRAEVERLRQLVNGGRGPLPAGAVAWLDMSPGEASLAFDKKSDSNRANKRRVMELFHRVSAGYYPLYLEPQADRAERLSEALDELADEWEDNGWPDPASALRSAIAALDPTAAQENDDA